MGSFALGGCVPVRRRTRRFGHAALPPCSVFAPRRTTRRQRRGWLGWHRAAGRAKPARAPPCLAGLLIQTREHHPAEAEPGPLHVVRIRTDTFLRRGKCPKCSVRWGWSRRSVFAKLPFPLSGRRGGTGSFARGGRVTVRRRTRRFGHAALAPCSVFAPRRTTRRKCRGWLSFQLMVSQTTGQCAALPCRIALACPFPSLLRGAILESDPQQKEAF